jgi:hypothetical protein
VGNIEGYVFKGLSESASADPATSYKINIFNSSGKLFKIGKVQFDGYFSIEGLPVGNYQLEVISRSGKESILVPISVPDWGDYFDVGEIYFDDYQKMDIDTNILQ